MKKILIIKHGSLGDIIFSLPVMHSIFINYDKDEIDILTHKKYINFLGKTNYFKNLIEDSRSKNFFLILKLLNVLKKKKYDLIIDLQNSSRTCYYNLFFRLLTNSTISSSRRFAHLRYFIPTQGAETVTNGLFNQIKILDISPIKNINYNWLQEKLEDISDEKFILFIPGVSKKGISKQWDPEKYGELARYCEEKKYKICIIGTSHDKKSASYILKNCNNIINKIDKSPPEIIYSIAQKAHLIISNDTGPGHIAALSETNILFLLNDNLISKANIKKNSNYFKILEASVSNIKTNQVIKFIENNNLL